MRGHKNGRKKCSSLQDKPQISGNTQDVGGLRMELKKERECKILKNGIIGCRVELPNGKEVSQLYEAPPKCIDIVAKHFNETVVRQKIIEEQKIGNKIDKTKAWLGEKPLLCHNKYTFKERGNLKVMEETSECIEGKKRWEKGVDRAKDILQTV